jgi:hypothetical protein
MDDALPVQTDQLRYRAAGEHDMRNQAIRRAYLTQDGACV